MVHLPRHISAPITSLRCLSNDSYFFLVCKDLHISGIKSSKSLKSNKIYQHERYAS